MASVLTKRMMLRNRTLANVNDHHMRVTLLKSLKAFSYVIDTSKPRGLEAGV
jgi:hypothetical protein